MPAPNMTAPKGMRPTWAEREGERGGSVITVAALESPLSETEREGSLKINTVSRLDITDAVRTRHPVTAKYTFFFLMHMENPQG